MSGVIQIGEIQVRWEVNHFQITFTPYITNKQMDVKHLINDTYQVVDGDNVLFQGTSDECQKYMMDWLLNKIKSTPELLDVFKRLANK